jgi:hypothetical protein
VLIHKEINPPQRRKEHKRIELFFDNNLLRELCVSAVILVFYACPEAGDSGRLPGLRDDGLEFLLIVHRQTEFTEMRFCQRSHGKNQLIDAGIEQH